MSQNNNGGAPTVEDLLDEEGNFDASQMTKYRANRPRFDVTDQDCQRIRRALGELGQDTEIDDIAPGLDFSATTIRTHAKAECRHGDRDCHVQYTPDYGWHYADDPVIRLGTDRPPEGKVWTASTAASNSFRYHTIRCSGVQSMRNVIEKDADSVEEDGYTLCQYCERLESEVDDD